MNQRLNKYTLLPLLFLALGLFGSPVWSTTSLLSVGSSDTQAQAIDSAVGYVQDLYYRPDSIDRRNMLRSGYRAGLNKAGIDTGSVDIDQVIPSNPGWDDLRSNQLKAGLEGLFKQANADTEVTHDLIYHSAEGMFLALQDDYSRLIDRNEYEELKTDTSQEFGGLGIFISFEDGELTVIAPIKGTPAFDANLRPQDQIVAINGEPTSSLANVNEAVDKLRGEIGSSVNLTILRNGHEFDVEITRDEIPIRTVYSRMVDKEAGIGVVRITNFGEKTSQEVQEAIQQLQEKGLNALLLDLRGNPGGLLSSASQVADLWIEDGSIVSTRGRTSDQNQSFPASQRSISNDYELAVLVDQGSASGSEIVAGALRDHNRAVLMGQETFGKGLVQSVFPLDDGSALSLTTARYFTPNGDVIEEGIKPQVTIEQKEPDEQTQEELVKLQQGDTVTNWVRNHEDLSRNNVPDELVQELRRQGFDLDRQYIQMQYNQALARAQGKTVLIDPQTDSQLHRGLDTFRELLDQPGPVTEAVTETSSPS